MVPEQMINWLKSILSIRFINQYKNTISKITTSRCCLRRQKFLLIQEFIARDIKEADIVNSNGDIQRISAKNFVITTGYNIGNIYKQITGDSLNVRFWKSHLIVLPRLAKHGLIFVGNGKQ